MENGTMKAAEVVVGCRSVITNGWYVRGSINANRVTPQDAIMELTGGYVVLETHKMPNVCRVHHQHIRAEQTKDMKSAAVRQ